MEGNRRFLPGLNTGVSAPGERLEGELPEDAKESLKSFLEASEELLKEMGWQ